MDPEQIQFHVERRYLQRILELVTTGNMTEELAHQSAQVLVAMRPWLNLDEAINKIDYLVSKFPEFRPVLEYIIAVKNEKDTDYIVDQMHEHLRSNNIGKALEVAQISNVQS